MEDNSKHSSSFKKDLRTLRRFLGFLKRHWKLGALGGAIMLVSVALQLPMPLLTMYLIDDVVVSGNVQALHVVGLCLLAFLALKAGAAYAQNYVLQVFRNRVLFDIRCTLFLHLERLPLAFHDVNRAGYLASRLTSDVGQVQGLFASTFLVAIRQILTFVVGVVMVFWLHWKLALVAISILPLFIYWLTRLNPQLRELRYETQELYGQTTGDLLETLSNIYLVKSFATERHELTRLIRSLREALRTDFKSAMTATVLSAGALFLSSLGKLALIWYGCWLIIGGELTIGAFLAFNSFLRYLFEPAESLVGVNETVQRSLAAVDRLYEILDLPREENLVVPPAWPRTRRLTGAVRFENVSFSYDGDVQALQDFSLEVPAGSTVAIVGRSGSGKSTLLKLLMRLYTPQSGAIYFDDTEVRDFPLRTLRRQIALVPQDTFLFSGTVWDNLRYGKLNASTEQLRACAVHASADDFLSRLPEGYETQIGERGIRLSGGQRQRLSIAMAFVKDAPILVLDEATASVDNVTERRIQKSLERLMDGRTTFIAAHRLTTVKQADMIVVLDGGRLVEKGNHDELMTTNGRYRQLYSSYLAA